MKKAVIASILRTAVGKSHKGSLVNVRSEDLAKAVLNAVLKALPQTTPNKNLT